MLPRVVRLIGSSVSSVIVVAAPDQEVPPLPDGVRLVRDAVGGLGPLGGLAAGLAAVADEADAIYLSACDVPLIESLFVRRVVSFLAEPTITSPLIAIPSIHDRLHPLAAAYRVAILPMVRAMLSARQLRMTDLSTAVSTRFIEAHELVDLDPEFRSLRNLNTPQEYEDALRVLGLAPSNPR
jgi:molybdopterin-guanine dinucleotide biosynthesis protein A